ncbi:MAG: MmgE/PrpD family protein [Rhodospirillaceae bacterium]|nr:MmgE/PrpD family protein [Rhodospirillaceae bacterium]MBT6136546.1 MmgE/PrpD family protein [Rhodospirillaceae bacterium]
MAEYLEQLSEFLADCTYEDLSSDAVERARLVIADSVAAIAGGSREPEVMALTKQMVSEAGTGPSAVIGAGLRTEPAKAAFLNGTAGTFLEMDEGNQFSRGHPAIHVVPSALAWGEMMGVSGKDAMLAIVLGYEVGSRIGISAKIRMSMHPHGTWGTVGSAVTVAKLAGATKDQMREVINVSSCLGLGTSRQTMLQGGTVRNSYAGFSGQMGIMAWQMVTSGMTGEHDGLTTIWSTVLSEEWRPEEMTRELGSRWEIARNYFKRHSCCRYNHGTLDALAMVMDEHPGAVTLDTVDRVEVETYSLAVQLSDKNPRNTLAAKFSVPFAVATTIVNGSSGMQSFTWDAIGDERVTALAAKVEINEDPKLTALMPDFRPARVRIHLKDGQVLEAETQTNRGDTEDPYSVDDLTGKYYELAERVWPNHQASRVHQACTGFDGLADVKDLTRLFDSTEPAGNVRTSAQ